MCRFPVIKIRLGRGKQALSSPSNSSHSHVYFINCSCHYNIQYFIAVYCIRIYCMNQRLYAFRYCFLSTSFFCPDNSYFYLIHMKCNPHKANIWGGGKTVNVVFNICPETWARICEPFKASKNRFQAWRAVMITLFDVYWPRLFRLAESISWNRFLGSLNVYKFGLCCRNGWGSGDCREELFLADIFTVKYCTYITVISSFVGLFPPPLDT